MSVGQYSSPELEVCATYPLGTTPILFWMSTMETDVVGMDWNIPLRENQRRGPDNPSDVVGVKRQTVLIGGNTLIPSISRPRSVKDPTADIRCFQRFFDSLRPEGTPFSAKSQFTHAFSDSLLANYAQ